jgi:hypothetical protein
MELSQDFKLFFGAREDRINFESSPRGRKIELRGSKLIELGPEVLRPPRAASSERELLVIMEIEASINLNNSIGISFEQ